MGNIKAYLDLYYNNGDLMDTGEDRSPIGQFTFRDKTVLTAKLTIMGTGLSSSPQLTELIVEIVDDFLFPASQQYLHLRRIQLPEVPVPTGEGSDIKLFDMAKSVHWIVDDSTFSGDGGLKRRRMLPGGDDSDDEGGPAPPANDIYSRNVLIELFNVQIFCSIFHKYV